MTSSKKHIERKYLDTLRLLEVGPQRMVRWWGSQFFSPQTTFLQGILKTVSLGESHGIQSVLSMVFDEDEVYFHTFFHLLIHKSFGESTGNMYVDYFCIIYYIYITILYVSESYYYIIYYLYLIYIYIYCIILLYLCIGTFITIITIVI